MKKRTPSLLTAALGALVMPALLLLEPTAMGEDAPPRDTGSIATSTPDRSVKIAGRVTANGRPVPNAFVVVLSSVDFATTDPNGNFEFVIEEGGEFSVQVHDSLLGNISCGLFSILDSGSHYLELEFPNLGGLSGSIRGCAPGSPEEERWLYLFHNETEDMAYVAIEQDDTFAIPALQAGVWSASLCQVRRATPRLVIQNSPFALPGERTEGSVPLAWIPVLVSEDVDSMVDLNFRVEPKCLITGTVRFEFEDEWDDMGPSCAFGYPDAEIRIVDPIQSAIVCAASIEGNDFALVAREDGVYQIEATVHNIGVRTQTFTREVSLDIGENTWDFQNTGARIRAQITPPLTRFEQDLVYEWSDGEGTRSSDYFSTDYDDDTLLEAIVPSGHLEIYFSDRDGTRQLLEVVDVAPNQDLELQLARD